MERELIGMRKINADSSSANLKNMFNFIKKFEFFPWHFSFKSSTLLRYVIIMYLKASYGHKMLFKLTITSISEICNNTEMRISEKTASGDEEQKNFV